MHKCLVLWGNAAPGRDRSWMTGVRLCLPDLWDVTCGGPKLDRVRVATHTDEAEAEDGGKSGPFGSGSLW